MPSPFPGMDPYLEAPDIWPDFHERLAEVSSALLNEQLPEPYYARLVMRPEVGIGEESGTLRRIVPDIAVARRPASGPAGSGVGVIDQARTDISKSVELDIRSEPIRHAFVEIRDPTRGHHLITLMEIVSPSNKRPGLDQKAYIKKQQEVLESDASLIEIDLLRSGDRLLAHAELESLIGQMDPAPDYLVLVNRAWKRAGAGMNYQIFPILLTESLPCIPVPLREKIPEIPLDLQFVMNQVYNRGPYRRVLDYGQPANPPLPEGLMNWAKQLLGIPTNGSPIS